MVKRPLRLRHRWGIILNCILKEIGCEGMDKIHLTQDRNLWQVLLKTGTDF